MFVPCCLLRVVFVCLFCAVLLIALGWLVVVRCVLICCCLRFVDCCLWYVVCCLLIGARC